MKSLLCFLLLIALCGHSVVAQEGNNPETKPEGTISSGTKKVLRKVGRKARDTSCEMTEDKAKCEKEKSEHAKANIADEVDTKKRKMDKAIKEYDEAVEKQKKME